MNEVVPAPNDDGIKLVSLSARAGIPMLPESEHDLKNFEAVAFGSSRTEID